MCETLTGGEPPSPSIAGVSHNPAEATAQADLIAGAQVLLDVVSELAGDAETAP